MNTWIHEYVYQYKNSNKHGDLFVSTPVSGKKNGVVSTPVSGKKKKKKRAGDNPTGDIIGTPMKRRRIIVI